MKYPILTVEPLEVPCSIALTLHQLVWVHLTFINCTVWTGQVLAVMELSAVLSALVDLLFVGFSVSGEVPECLETQLSPVTQQEREIQGCNMASPNSIAWLEHRQGLIPEAKNI